MASQGAGVGAAVVTNGCAIVLTHHVRVEVYQSLARYARRNRSHAVSGVARRTAESVLRYVESVLRKAVVRDDVTQIVTLRAHGIRPCNSKVRTGEQIRDQSSRSRCLAELVVALENVRIHRPMRTVRSIAPKFPIVVAIVAVRTKNAGPRCSRRRNSILIQLIDQKAGLRQGT